ncbi:MAG TPA: hypothetical protein VIE17_08870 [Methylophilaceae bacterium]
MLKQRFDTATLMRITDTSMIYTCACPAQIAQDILSMRKLYAYQQDCMSQEDSSPEVHLLIADAVEHNHARMETTLDRVLTIQNWNRETWEMPEEMRKRLKTAFDNAG